MLKKRKGKGISPPTLALIYVTVHVLQVASLKQELQQKSERLTASKSERNRLEAELDQVNTQLRTAKKQSREQNLGSSLTQVSLCFTFIPQLFQIMRQ